MSLRILVKTMVVLAVIGLSTILMCNIWIVNSAKSNMYYAIDELPELDVALVLGTSDKLVSGEENPFFKARIDMAVQLYKSGKVKFLLVSGDNRSRYYNEPLKMKKALMEKGIPENVITLDYAGLRTLDSIVRCKEIFGQDNFVIITQSFHCHRALFLSKYHGINAIGMATTSLPFSVTYKILLREILARTVAIWDTYVMNTQPRHLGDKEIINTGDD